MMLMYICTHHKLINYAYSSRVFLSKYTVLECACLNVNPSNLYHMYVMYYENIKSNIFYYSTYRVMYIGCIM